MLARTLGVPLFQEQLLRMAMIAAGFTGGEAEELRRAFGFKRSEARMKEIEKKLRAGMMREGIAPDAQEMIVKSITSFALYGFPESHAASFALLAYASAYLKCHYLAAFTAAMLNNQPMGFYSPATIVKDAQRHGLRVKPLDVAHSDWKCTLEREFDPMGSNASKREKWAVRLGLRYARGVREEDGASHRRGTRDSPFASIEELKRRVPDDSEIRTGHAGRDRRAELLHAPLHARGRSRRDRRDRNGRQKTPAISSARRVVAGRARRAARGAAA